MKANQSVREDNMNYQKLYTEKIPNICKTKELKKTQILIDNRIDSHRKPLTKYNILLLLI